MCWHSGFIRLSPHLNAQDKSINKLINSRGPNCGWVWWYWCWWCWWWQVGQKLVKKSENCQKAQKASKIWKNYKGHWFGGTFTEAPVFHQRTQTFDKTLTVFRALFAGPKSSFDTMFKAIIVMVRLAEPLMLCRVFPQRSQEDLRVFHQL